MTHDHNGPSQAGRRVGCPGSMTLEAKAIEQGLDTIEDKEDAALGTLLHQIVAHKAIPPVGESGLASDWPDWWIVERCWKYMAEKIPGRPGFEPPWLEQEITLPLFLYVAEIPEVYDDGRKVTSGTLDVLYLDPARIIVIDWKMHRAEPDEEAIAWQMKLGAAMAIQKWRKVAREKNWTRERLGSPPAADIFVYFPRLRVDGGTGLELTATFGDDQEIAREYDQALQYSRTHPEDYRPTAGRCQYCKAKAICPAFKDDMAVVAATPKPDTSLVSLEELGRWYFEFKPKAAIIAKLDKAMTDALKKQSPEALASIGLELVARSRGGYTAKPSSWMELRKKGTTDGPTTGATE